MSKYTIELLKTGIASGKNALAHQQEAKEIYAKVTALRVAAQAEMATLNAQYQLAQSEKTRMALREQMKIQSQQIIALAHEEANAKRNLATANKLAATAAKGLQGAMALIGGPIGAASIAGGALWYFSQQASEARRWALDTANANQLLAQSYKRIQHRFHIC